MIAWVYDGDTFEAVTGDGTTDVRLLGMNAPDEGECFHTEATDYLIGSIRGEEVELESMGTDQFGRTLAHVWHAGLHVNVDLVDRGLAIASTPDDGEPYGSELFEAEENAWSDRRGLWSEHACGPSSPIPEVRIVSVEANPSGLDDEVLGEEAVVIANEGPNVENLTGWVLRDESSRHRYHFASGTRIGPGETLTITSSADGWNPGGTPVWNNDGDLVLLLDKHGRVVDRVRY